MLNLHSDGLCILCLGDWHGDAVIVTFTWRWEQGCGMIGWEDKEAMMTTMSITTVAFERDLWEGRLQSLGA